MNKDENVRFAVLGCGVISKFHVEGITNTQNAELAAVCDNVEQNMKEYAEIPGIRTYADYKELLAQDDIDVICICTPSGMHTEQTIMAAKAGKHVICEKPMAIHLEDVDRMIQTCKDYGVLLAAIYPWRMSPVIRYVKQFIEQGGLGKLSLCSAYIKPYRTQQYFDKARWRGTWKGDGGGVLMNQGIHTVDQLQWIVGPVQSCSGQTKAILRNIEVEDTATALLNYKNGAMGVIEASTTAYKSPDSIVLHGEKGTIVLGKGEIISFEIEGEEKIELPEFEAFQVIPDGHQNQINDMVHAVRENRKPEVSGDDGRHSIEIILGIYESSRKKEEIAVGE